MEAVKRLFFFQKFFEIRCIRMDSFALAIVFVRPADNRAFISFNTKPFESFKNIFFIFLIGSLEVSIFNAENKFFVVFFGKKIIKKRGTGSTDMEHSGWAWCDANAY